MNKKVYKKIYLSVDIEGIWGVGNKNSTSYDGNGYENARENMIRETNLVIQNLIDNGVEYILVNDGHGKMTNLIPNRIHEKAHIITSNNISKACGMMEGLNNEFDACIFIGYHAGIGTKNAVLNHTISYNKLSSIKLNGKDANETLLNSHLAWYYNVPVILVSGDDLYIKQTMKDFRNQLVAVETKRSLARECAINIPYEELEKRYSIGIEKALETTSYFMDKQDFYEMEIKFNNEDSAEFASRIPTVLRKDNYTVMLKNNDYLELYKLCRFCITVS